MPGYEFVRDLFEQASGQGSRSTVLKPLGWLMAILLAGTMGTFYVGAPIWVGVMLSVLAVVTTVAYLSAYGYFMFRSPDALRSETFTLHKMAIERGLLGDDLHGLMKVDPDVEPPRLGGPSTPAPGGKT